MWWLARTFEEQLVDFLSWLQRYQWWAVGISIVLVVLVNMRNFRHGAARSSRRRVARTAPGLIQRVPWLK